MGDKKPKHTYTVPIPLPLPNDDSKFWHLLSGGISGGISRTVTAPFERLKIIRQCSTKEYAGVSLVHSMKQFYQTEGLTGFFKGNGSNIIRIVPFSAIEFYAFEKSKNYLLPQDNPRHKGWLLACGSISGICASFFTYPIDLVRTYLSIDTKKASEGLVKEGVRIFKQEGVVGLYRGIGMTLAGIGPFIGIKMTTFDLLKSKYMPPADDPKFGMMNLFLGAAAGTTATVLTYPSDLLRRKMQLKAFSPTKNVPYNNIVECVKFIMATEGVPGFYNGLVPTLLKVVPTMAVLFWLNEHIKNLIGIK